MVLYFDPPAREAYGCADVDMYPEEDGRDYTNMWFGSKEENARCTWDS
jgi:hypothetical protein